MEVIMVSTKKIQRVAISLAASAMILFGTMVPAVTQAASQDCDANAVIWCGATSVGSLQHSYWNGDGHNSAASIEHIYAWFGITGSAINGMNTTSVNGTVTKSGQVLVGGKVVATGAVTGGRQNISGSTQESWGGTTFWARKPSVSFLDNSLTAFVVMKNGQFQFAVLTACGNAVKATPVPKPTPTPTSTPKPTPTPTPTKTPAPTQSFSCVVLTPTVPDKNKPSTFRFTVTPKVSNVTLTGFRFSFDNGTPTVDTASDMAFVDRTVDAGKSLTVHGQVKTSAGITDVSDACSATVSVKQAVVPTQTPQVLAATTTTLPATGPETALGGVAGLTAIGYAGRAYLRSRKSLIGSLRKPRQ